MSSPLQHGQGPMHVAVGGLLLNLVLLAHLSDVQHMILRIGSALLISASAVLINSSSYEIGAALRFVLQVLETPNVGLLWWFGTAIFRDNFRLQPVHWLGMLVACVLGFSIRMHYFGWVAPFPGLRHNLAYALAFALMAHLLWSVLKDAAGDLVNARRSARFWSAATFALVGMGIGIAAMTLPHAVQSFGHRRAPIEAYGLSV